MESPKAIQSDNPENKTAMEDAVSNRNLSHNPEKRPAPGDASSDGKKGNPPVKKQRAGNPKSGSDSSRPKDGILKTPKEEFSESLFKRCVLCAQNKPNYRIFRVRKCRHEFCHDCFGKRVDATLQKKTHILVCPAMNCKEVIGFQSCCNLLPDEVREKWDKMLCEALFESYEKFYCPFEGCKEMMVKETNEVIKEAECPSCFRLFCSHCSVPWHASVSCDEFQKTKVP